MVETSPPSPSPQNISSAPDTAVPASTPSPPPPPLPPACQSYPELLKVISTLAGVGFNVQLSEQMLLLEVNDAEDEDEDNEERAALLSDYLDTVSDALSADISCDVPNLVTLRTPTTSHTLLKQLRYIQNCCIKAASRAQREPTERLTTVLTEPSLFNKHSLFAKEVTAREVLCSEEASAASILFESILSEQTEGSKGREVGWLLDRQWEGRAALLDSEAGKRVELAVLRAKDAPVHVSTSTKIAHRAAEISLLADAIRRKKIPFQALNTAFLSHLHQMPHHLTPMSTPSSSTATSLSAQS